MIKFLYSFIIASFLLFSNSNVWAQPELKSLYKEANDAMDQRNYERAINIYFQAIRINPSDIVLRRDLAYAYLLNNQSDKGLEVITEIINAGRADEESYQLASALEKSKGNNRKALGYINSGLSNFPNSGLLHHAKGLHYLSTNPSKQSNAIPYFSDGIKLQPNYANNYLSLAKILSNEKEYVWTAIYAETYILLEHNGSRVSEAKRLLYDTYKNLYSDPENIQIPSLEKRKGNKKSSFSILVNSMMQHHFPVFAREFGVEQITAFRTRFTVEWMQYQNTARHSLFEYWNRILANGHFDAYNQFLFGAVNDSQAFATWSKNNNEALSKLQNWMAINQYLPNVKDPNYNQ